MIALYFLCVAENIAKRERRAAAMTSAEVDGARRRRTTGLRLKRKKTASFVVWRRFGRRAIFVGFDNWTGVDEAEDKIEEGREREEEKDRHLERES